MATAEAAEAILIAHQRHRGGCLCGWSELGKSHPGHQVAMLRDAALLLPDPPRPEGVPMTEPRQSPAGGPWTQHGHPIPGITVVGGGRPPVARCGGPALCGKCRDDETRIRAEVAR